MNFRNILDKEKDQNLNINISFNLNHKINNKK